MRLRDKILRQIASSKLLAKYFLGTLNKEEQAEMQDWMADNGNKKLLDELGDEKNRAERNRIIDSINLDEEWRLFIKSMEIEKRAATKNLRIKIYSAVASVAAVFVLGLMMVFGPWDNPFSDNELLAEEININPGRTTAELILPDGEVINLEAIKNTVVEDDNIKISNNEGILLYEPQKIVPLDTVKNILRVPRGGEYQLVLEDSTVVWLNSESQLTYPRIFSADQRKVELIGEAYFDVKRDERRPFVVVSKSQQVTVLGTEFDISAYEQDDRIFTTLVEGKVKVEIEEGDGQVHTEFLEPNEQVVYDINSNDMKRDQVDPYEYSSWKDGRFVFNNEPLSSLMSKISRWYDIDYRFEEEGVGEIRFTGDLKRYSNLADFLKILEVEKSLKVVLEEEEQTLVISQQ
ncbi:FecR domain-containing protein [Draconibacterium sp. IB214405]|uniref:FecR family protein n=1 Tax=Draconibacterium sp. IB214405 TaxID=3097352 RepID=UPI002A0C5EC0|nr:FecR domain-containing protein [Draconibacterium sp. IB214405]MDX8340292.1 FecR domain-containing protein [Draconibacterium sp. IB214405]